MQKIELALLKIDYLLGAAVVIAQLLGLQNMVSRFFYGTFIVTALFWLFTLIREIDGLDYLAVMILTLAWINVALNGAYAGASFTFQYVKKYIMFSSTILFFSAASKSPIHQKDFRWFEHLYLGIVAFFILMYIMQNGRMHLLNGRSTRYLVFNFTNPNLTALFLACIMMALVVLGSYEQRTVRRRILFIAAASCVLFVFQTESRNSILVLCIFICLAAAVLLREKPLYIGKLASFSAVVFPMLFAELYLLSVQKLSTISIISFMTGEGKGIDSRVTIWERAMQAFRDSPILGAYYQLSGGTGNFQMHNTHVDILVSYGIAVLILVCIFLYKLLRKMQRTGQTPMQSVSAIAFMCALLLGMGEAALFSGGLAVYLYFGVFLLLFSLESNDSWTIRRGYNWLTDD